MDLPDLAAVDDLWSYQEGQPEAMVLQAQAAVRAYCGWHIAPAVDEALTVDGRGGRLLRLPTLKINSVASVTHEGAGLDLDLIDWSESGYLVRVGGCWSERPRQILVALNHGYESVPQDVLEIVVSIASRGMSSPSGAVREQAGQVQMQWATVASGVSGGLALLQHERDILNKYKLPQGV